MDHWTHMPASIISLGSRCLVPGHSAAAYLFVMNVTSASQEGLLAIGACHAAFALFAAVLFPEFPSEVSQTRVRGTFVYPNHAAAFWGCLLPLAITLSFTRKRGWYRIAAAALALAIIGSASRGGILVAAVINIPLLISSFPAGKRLFASCLAGALSIVFLWMMNVDYVLERFDNLKEQGPSLSGRLHIWSNAQRLHSDNSLWGSGAGTAELAYNRVDDGRFGQNRVDHIHNDYLECLIEFGPLGSSILVFAIIIAASMILRSWRGNQDPSALRYMIRLGAGLGVLHLLLHASGEFVFHREANGYCGDGSTCASDHQHAPA